MRLKRRRQHSVRRISYASRRNSDSCRKLISYKKKKPRFLFIRKRWRQTNQRRISKRSKKLDYGTKIRTRVRSAFLSRYILFYFCFFLINLLHVLYSHTHTYIYIYGVRIGKLFQNLNRIKKYRIYKKKK